MDSDQEAEEDFREGWEEEENDSDANLGEPREASVEDEPASEGADTVDEVEDDGDEEFQPQEDELGMLHKHGLRLAGFLQPKPL